jgi:hypothetical protein
MPDIDTESATARAALLADHDPRSVLDRLPNTVFPMRLKLHLPPSRDADTAHEQFRSPDYPVELQQPQTPYIPETTVYFENPARRPREGATVWRPDAFSDRLTEILDHVTDASPRSGDALSLLELEVCEVPAAFVTTDSETGEHVVTPDMYKNEAELRIARFQREGSLTATQVRDRLDDALPGESRTPTRLTRIEEIHAKPARQGRTTTGTAGRAKYYTDTDAEQVDSLDLTPAVYQLQQLARDGDRTRPLTPVLSDLESMLPELIRGCPDLVSSVKFVGEERERTQFHATEVLDS